MNLTVKDIGRTLLWNDRGQAKLVTLVNFNPADDSEVQARIGDQLPFWVMTDELVAWPEGLHNGWVQVAQDLAECDRLKGESDRLVEQYRADLLRLQRHVGELLTLIDADTPRETWAPVLDSIRLDLE